MNNFLKKRDLKMSKVKTAPKKKVIAKALKHSVINSFPKEYFSIYKEFREGGTIREWVNAMLQLVNNYPFHGTEEEIVDARNKFKGDMLEVLAEIYFNIFDADEAVGIKNYAPVDLGNDYGVDATGINVNGHKVAVQVKFRSNPIDDLITYADMSRTYTSGILQLGNMDLVLNNNTLYLFTTAAGVSGACQKVFGKKLVVINRGVISTKIDNNKNFWEDAYRLIFDKLN